jgi:ribosomal protein L34
MTDLADCHLGIDKEITANSFYLFGTKTMENHRKSKIKRARKSGFRARMRTKGGRKILANRRKGFNSTRSKM